jgi:ferredoxin
MKVWIDQDLCTGDGLCAEIAPDVFTMKNDGLAYVQEVVGNFGELKIFSAIDGNDQGVRRFSSCSRRTRRFSNRVR